LEISSSAEGPQVTTTHPKTFGKKWFPSLQGQLSAWTLAGCEWREAASWLKPLRLLRAHVRGEDPAPPDCLRSFDSPQARSSEGALAPSCRAPHGYDQTREIVRFSDFLTICGRCNSSNACTHTGCITSTRYPCACV